MHGLPPITDSTALFLDFDGTLAEIAPRPDAVQLAPGLIGMLAQLHRALAGALAIVSGRRLDDLDRLLQPLHLPAAGEHGACRRLGDGRLCGVEPPDLTAVRAAVHALAARHAGLLVEDKTAAISLHYRLAPELETLCQQTLTALVADHPALDLMHGKCVLEIKPAGTSKGHAIEAFMREPPFLGRLPLFAGDDVTDEAGFAAVQRLGGAGLKVGAGPSLARHRCATPQALQAWLDAGIQRLAAGLA